MLTFLPWNYFNLLDFNDEDSGESSHHQLRFLVLTTEDFQQSSRRLSSGEVYATPPKPFYFLLPLVQDTCNMLGLQPEYCKNWSATKTQEVQSNAEFSNCCLLLCHAHLLLLRPEQWTVEHPSSEGELSTVLVSPVSIECSWQQIVAEIVQLQGSKCTWQIIELFAPLFLSQEENSNLIWKTKSCYFTNRADKPLKGHVLNRELTINQETIPM